MLAAKIIFGFSHRVNGSVKCFNLGFKKLALILESTHFSFKQLSILCM